MTIDLPVISLFGGAGGLDLGFEDAGGSVRVSVEPDPHCVATVKLNRRFFADVTVLSAPIQDVSTDAILDAARPARTSLQKGGARVMTLG